MTSCEETRDALEAYRRGELEADAARAVESHLARCPACRQLREGADALAALVRALPRPPAPPGLRRRVERLAGPPHVLGRWLARPWVAAVVTAVVVAAALSPWVRFRAESPADPVATLLQAGVAEHTRIVLQLQLLQSGVADPASTFAMVRSITNIELPWAFAGDNELTLVVVRPTMIANRKAAAVVLRDPGRSITTYFAVPGKDLSVPATRRVQIEQYKPYMQQLNGLNVIYWKQGDLAYVMVSELDDAGSRRLFLRMRKAL